MKICIIGKPKSLLDSIKEKLELIGEDDIKVVIAATLSPEEFIKNAFDCEILIFGSGGIKYLSKDVINGLKKLKFISILGAGADFLDLDEVKKCGVVVSNLKGVNAEAVAEHCFGMILDLAKRITESDRGIREKGEYSYVPYLGKEIYGKTLGIVGLGDIGKRVARIAKGFSMEVIGMNKSKRDISGIQIVSLDQLLRKSDIIAVTVPLTKDTENLLSEQEFSIMKDGVILVSTSREKIINKKAVLKAVDSGKVFGFGFEADIMVPIDKNDQFLKQKRIIVTPHTGFNTEEALEQYVRMTVENVGAFLNGKPIRVVV